ncbi:MAG: glycosyltransferase family 1 protein [Erythrobacter sp.]
MLQNKQRPRVAANLCFVESRGLTGPGYYAVQVFENLALLAENGELDFELKGYIQDNARHHFSLRALAHLTTVGSFSGRVTRVVYEQAVLPFRSRRERVDILWSPAFVSPCWGARYLTATIHDMYYEVVPETVERWQKYYWAMMVPLTAIVCEGLLVNSTNTRRDVVRHLPVDEDRIFVTPLASRIHAEQFSPQPRLVQERYALFVANTTPNKNCRRVMEALARLDELGHPLKLLHIGKDIEGNLRHTASQLGAEDQLISLGQVSEDEIVSAYQHCEFTIVASLYEGFGMPAAEALAMGAPLICSDRSALPEAAGGLEARAALFVDPTNTSALLDAMVRLLDDPVLRAELVKNGLEHARTMSWQKTARLTAAAFRTMAPQAFQ